MVITEVPITLSRVFLRLIYESDAGAGAVNNNPYCIRDISVTVKYRCLSREHWLHSTAFSLKPAAPTFADLI